VENKGFVQVGNPANPNSYQIQTGLYNTKYIGVCPANNVIKSAVTLMSKAYYGDTRAYLQSRCKRYEQKLSTNPVPGIQYIGADHMPNWPTDECNGPQTRLTGSCLYPACSAAQRALPTKCQGTTIYKPNNVPFARQGGVSSSTRTLSLRVNTVNLNGNSFYSAFGAEGANAGKYSTEYNNSLFIQMMCQKFGMDKKDLFAFFLNLFKNENSHKDDAANKADARIEGVEVHEMVSGGVESAE
jgi:hypothetical protein